MTFFIGNPSALRVAHDKEEGIEKLVALGATLIDAARAARILEKDPKMLAALRCAGRKEPIKAFQVPVWHAEKGAGSVEVRAVR